MVKSVFEGANTFCPKSVLVGRFVYHANSGTVRISVMKTATTRSTIQKTVAGEVDTVDSESELFLTDMGKKPTRTMIFDQKCCNEVMGQNFR